MTVQLSNLTGSIEEPADFNANSVFRIGALGEIRIPVSAPQVNSGAVSGLIYWRNPFGLLNKLRNHPNQLPSDGSIWEPISGPTFRPSIASGCFRSRGHRRNHYDRTAKETVRFGTLRNSRRPALIGRLDSSLGYEHETRRS